MSSNLAKNTAYLTFATVVQKILAFVYFTLIARTVGVELTGKYFFALSFSYIFSVFIDFGMNYVLIREIAKDRSKLPKFLNNVFTVKIILSLVTFLMAIIIINLLGYDSLTIHLVYLAMIAIIFDSFHLNFYGIFRGIQNLKYEAIGVIIYEIIIISFGAAVLIIQPSLPMLILALILGSSFHIFYTLTLFKKKLGVFPKIELDFEFLKKVFIIALPFAIACMFVKVYSYVDSVLLSLFSGDAYVGWYSVAYKITYAFQFIPMAFVAALYPAFASAWVGSHDKLVKLFEQSLRYMMIIAVPICFGIWSIADKVIPALYGAEFNNSIIPLQILIFVLFFIFLDFPVGSLLNACDRQVTKTTITGLIMVINVILNIILIPRYNVIGASLAGLLSFSFMFFASIYFAKKIVKFKITGVLRHAVKIIGSGLAMTITVLLLKPSLHFALLIPLGAIVYFLALLAIRALKYEDLVYLKKIIGKQSINE